MKKSKGSTLVELMFSIAIYALLSLFLLAIFKIGIKSWKDIENKTVADRGFSMFSTDVAFSVGNARSTDINSYFCSSTGDGWLLCSSAALNGSSLSVPSFSEHDFDIDVETKKLSWNFKILYFSARHKDCSLCNSIWGKDAKYCPHKIIVKRWFALEDEGLYMDLWSNNSSNYVSSDGSAVPFYATPIYSAKRYDKLLSENIIAFKPSVSGNIFSYSIKACKNSAKIYYENDLVKKSIDVFSQPVSKNGYFEKSQEKEPMEGDTIQINGSVAALN